MLLFLCLVLSKIITEIRDNLCQILNLKKGDFANSFLCKLLIFSFLKKFHTHTKLNHYRISSFPLK